MSIGVAILSWKAPNTLKNTIKTYNNVDFFSLFDQKIICFQEISEFDKKVAEEQMLDYIGTEKNTGIQGGFKRAFEELNTNYILILENDCIIIENKESVREQIKKAVNLIESNDADLVRLRSRFNPGVGGERSVQQYTKYHELIKADPRFNLIRHVNNSNPILKLTLRLLRPDKSVRCAGRSVYIEQNPHLIFPRIITKKGDSFIVDSRALPWTNQPTLIKRELFGKILSYAETHPSNRKVNGFQDLERPLNGSWWRNSNFRIGIIDGFFSHKRLDR